LPKVKVGDINIYYEIYGKGFPLVMIRGLSSSLDSWSPFTIKKLSETFKVIIFDNRGAGRTEPVLDGKYSAKMMADDTIGLMDAIDVEKAFFVGYSLGGCIAQEIVLNYSGFIIGKKKSKSIELPQLASREYYLAFILGYYDGDGKVGSTVITSGSIKFIRQVKSHFKITHKIWRTDSEWDGVGYNIYLGMDLMREMLPNYKNSLHRKRKHFEK